MPDPTEERSAEEAEAERQRLIRQAEQLQHDVEELKQRWDEVARRQSRGRPRFTAEDGLQIGLPILAAGFVTLTWSWPVGLVCGFLTWVVVLNVREMMPRSSSGEGQAMSRAWEAARTVELLDQAIALEEKKLDELDEHADPGPLKRSIVHLIEQRAAQQAIADSGDPRPGTGSIGFTVWDDERDGPGA
jgi:hypothetical protein